MNKRSFIDLFAGCGGLSLGLENAGFIPILVNELSDEARETYLTNRTGSEFSHFNNCLLDDPENPWVWKDVANLLNYIKENYAGFQEKTLKIHGVNLNKGDLDLIVGGPPCQGYSGIGHRRSYSVDRRDIPSNHMYQNMIAIINILHPKMFLFENVKGLLTAKWYRDDKNSIKGEIWRDVRLDFKKILGDDYIIGWHLVHAYEYSLPQNRPRILLVGIRKDLGWISLSSSLDNDGILINDNIYRAGGLLPDPIGHPPSLEDMLGDLIDNNFEYGGETKYYPQPARTKIAKEMRKPKGSNKPLGKGKIVTEMVYSKHNEKIRAKFLKMIINGGDIPLEDKTKKFSQRVLPRRWPSGIPTITITSMPDDYIHYEQARTLTVREWARLQYFPDWYEFKGKRTTGGLRRAGNPRKNNFEREVPKYTQIGNAVPVLMAEIVGKHLMKILDICDKEK